MTDMASTETRLTDHLIEAAVMRQEIEHVKQLHTATSNQLLHVMGELSADMKAVRQQLGDVPKQIQQCRLEMRHEIERDFQTRNDSLLMEKRIEDKVDAGNTQLRISVTALEAKVDKQWLKITVALSAVGAVFAGVLWVLDFFSKLPKLPVG